jgi:DNA-directed RNA polymerase specialized sigma24 family protein
VSDFPNLDLSCLTPRQREVIEMHYCHRLSFGQIAMFLGSNYHAVAEMHRRALIVIRSSIGVDTAGNKVDA